MYLDIFHNEKKNLKKKSSIVIDKCVSEILNVRLDTATFNF